MALTPFATATRLVENSDARRDDELKE